MSAESDLYGLLSVDAGVIALADDRIYPDVAEQSAARPMVVYSRAATDLQRTIGGDVVATVSTLSVLCLAETREDAEAMADAVVAALASTVFDVVGRSGGYDPEVLVFNATLTVVHYE